MSLLRLRGIELSYGADTLLNDIDLQLDHGERVCLIGRNGAGKSTLLRVVAGRIEADSGRRECHQGLRIAWLDQDVPAGQDAMVRDIVAAGLGATDDRSGTAWDDGGQGHRLDATLSLFELDGNLSFASLSGGCKRRVMLARAWVGDPDILLLDEPTNHLDIATIEWLEGLLRSFRGILLFITHDRRLLRALATRIIELDRGRLTSWPGDYDNYLRRRVERLEAEMLADKRLGRRLAEEEHWIRQGIKARRTRNEGRVRALKALREEVRNRRRSEGAVQMNVEQAGRSGRRVIEVSHLGHGHGSRRLIDDLSMTIWRGDRIGIIGPNGAGKTTLLRLLLGEIAPEQGEVILGTRLEIAYFDQLRDQLDGERSVRDNIADGQDFIEIGGQSRHVMSYLQDFLFTPQRAMTPVHALSGGERNRLLLARLFARPSNVLVLDEPTNDLDIETLELLEERLLDYAGTLLLVSHDRAFLDHCTTSLLIMEGDGRVEYSVGGYEEWFRQRSQAQTQQTGAGPEERKGTRYGSSARRPRRLGYQKQRELARLPAQIESIEARIAAWHETMAEPGFFRKTREEITTAQTELSALESELAAAYERWQSLEAEATGSSCLTSQ